MQRDGCIVFCKYVIFALSQAAHCIREFLSTYLLVFHTQTLVITSGTFVVNVLRIVFLGCQIVLYSSAAADSSSAALSPEVSWLAPKRQPIFQGKRKIIQKYV